MKASDLLKLIQENPNADIVFDDTVSDEFLPLKVVKVVRGKKPQIVITWHPDICR